LICDGIDSLHSGKSRYPDAKLVALRFPAPPGQLEVWLKKIGS
jgi:hypothetical protein